MSNVSKWNDKATGRERAGFEMVKMGGGGILAAGLAGLLPFITLPMVLVALVVVGILIAI